MPVKNTQKVKQFFETKNARYSIDACLPQRKAIDSGKVGFRALSHGHYPGQIMNPSALQGVSSIGYFDVIGTQDWGIPPHRNEGVEICFQQTGLASLTVDGKGYEMDAKSLSITRPWQLHSMGNPCMRSGRLYWIILDVGVRHPNQPWQLPDWCVLTGEDKEDLVSLLRGNETPVWSATRETVNIFVRLGKLLDGSGQGIETSRFRLELNHLLIAILDMLRMHKPAIDNKLLSQQRTVDLFLKELREDGAILRLPWTLDSMAEYCGMGRTSFSNHCFAILNLTPMQALNRWRLEVAARQLRTEPSKKITDIALDVGFSSSQYFARKFHERFQMTAKEWRQSSGPVYENNVLPGWRIT